MVSRMRASRHAGGDGDGSRARFAATGGSVRSAEDRLLFGSDAERDTVDCPGEVSASHHAFGGRFSKTHGPGSDPGELQV